MKILFSRFLETASSLRSAFNSKMSRGGNARKRDRTALLHKHYLTENINRILFFINSIRKNKIKKKKKREFLSYKNHTNTFANVYVYRILCI